MSSTHCVGMCGGLVISLAPTKKDKLLYHVGRLMGYSSIFLAIIAFDIEPTGSLFIEEVSNLAFAFFSLLIIFVGYMVLRGRALEVKLPTFIDRLRSRMYSKILNLKFAGPRSFFIGFLSIMLPCGVLYMVLLALAGLANPAIGLIGVVFFWLGTLPLMHFGLHFGERAVKRVLHSHSQVFGILLIGVGLVSFIFRIVGYYGRAIGQSCH